MAPEAELHLVCVDSEVTLGQAKDYAIAQGIDVVAHGLAWFDTSRGDGGGGPGTPEGIVAAATAAGITWVTPAGNTAQHHWGGTFTDSDGDGRHEWAAGDEGNQLPYETGWQSCVHLKWDAWPQTTRDYDLHVVHPNTGTIVARSENAQRLASQPPVESVCIPSENSLQPLEVQVIDRTPKAGPPLRLDLHADFSASLGRSLEHFTTAQSLVEPAGAPGAITVGAHCVHDGALESYSSRGPTPDGRIKPDLSGPDGALAATSPYYLEYDCPYGGFPGTSAAAAHVAGAAALVLSAQPGLDPAGVRTFLEQRAVDAGAGGRDTAFGAGRIRLRRVLRHPGRGRLRGPRRSRVPPRGRAAAQRRTLVPRRCRGARRHGPRMSCGRWAMPTGSSRTAAPSPISPQATRGRPGPSNWPPKAWSTAGERSVLTIPSRGPRRRRCSSARSATRTTSSRTAASSPTSARPPRRRVHRARLRPRHLRATLRRTFRPTAGLAGADLVMWIANAWRMRYFAHVPLRVPRRRGRRRRPRLAGQLRDGPPGRLQPPDRVARGARGRRRLSARGRRRSRRAAPCS